MTLDRQPRLLIIATRSTRSGPRVIVAEMGLLARSGISLFLLAACADDAPFQSLGTLCDDLAEDICDARAGGCCGNVDPVGCRMAEVARCEPLRDALAAENLQFEARAAEEKLRAARVVLNTCGAPPALATFFTGGLPDGTRCERDTQCSGGLCTLDTRVCAAQVLQLCAP